MEFFKRFKELYNYSKSVENIIFINDEAWIDFQNKIKNYNFESEASGDLERGSEIFEELYKVILHYYYIETKKLEDFPYKLKIYNGTENGVKGESGNGITFEPKNLPVCLQYMLLNW